MRERRRFLRELALVDPQRFDPLSCLLEDRYLRAAAFGGFSPPTPALLDVAVSTRAAIADYTAARAAFLDQLQKIDALAVSGAPAANSLVDKINVIRANLPTWISIVGYQSGVASIASGQGLGTGTITSVDVTKSIVLLGGKLVNNGAVCDSFATAVLTDATTVTVSDDAGFATTRSVPFVVLTFAGLNSLQTGTVTITDNGATVTATATITSVNTAKAICIWQGCRGEYGGTALNILSGMAEVVLTNATTVTATRGYDPNAGGSLKTVYTILEFV